MEKVFIKFESEINENPILDKETCLNVYEGLKENNTVRVILPKVSHPSCVSFASNLDKIPYIVEGNYVGKNTNGEAIINNCVYASKLTFEKESETFTCDPNYGVTPKIDIPNTTKNDPQNLPELHLSQLPFYMRLGFKIGSALGVDFSVK